MKRFCAVILMLLLLFAVSCQEAGTGSVAKSNEEMSSPYREKSFLSFLVKYEDGTFSFSKAPWGASKAEWLQAMGLSEEDLSLGGGSDQEYETYIVKKLLYFEDISCSGVLMAEFYNDQLRLITVNMSGDASIWADNPYLDSEQEEYPEVNMLEVVSKVADQIEESSMPDSEINGGIDGGLRVERVADVAAQWFDSEETTGIAIPVFEIFCMSGTEVVSFRVRNNEGL